jgi:hypothetical protein
VGAGAYPGAVSHEPTAGPPAWRGPLATPDTGPRGADAVPQTASVPPSAVGGPAPAADVARPAVGPSGTGSAPVDPTPAPRPRRRSRWPVVLLVLALLAALGAAGYLYATTTAYADRVAWTEDQARRIGTELVTTRSELEGVRGELQGVRDQLATAQERITVLADEKAQIGDDREAQAQLLDYQARVSEAAGIVASALDRCVQGQDQLIEYLENADSYDPTELARFGDDVERLCASASEANLALQSELADR